MHKLLVPIDASDSARRALDYALRLAKENGPMELHIVNAHEEPIVFGEMAAHVDMEKLRSAQNQHSEKLIAPAVAKAKSAGLKASSEVLTGDIAQSVAGCAERTGCDAIVVGTRGMGALGNLVMGSVATKIVHATKLPVILVK